MPSFNRNDYQLLFNHGRNLYTTDSMEEVRRIAVKLMAMSEMVLGQQARWPNIRKKHHHLTVYPTKGGEVVKAKFG